MRAVEWFPKPSLCVVLPIELTNGNEGRSKHWGSAAKRRKSIAEVIVATVKVRPVETPTRLTITRILGKGERLYDADSLGRGNAKELIDALVAVGFLPDDGPRHVVECRFVQDASRRASGPAVEVRFEAVS